ncbi:hypothetical protein D1224_04165 [Henriciella barbarensis]|uniref:Uncharacterized protein n=1 Tax=Henriciella barbarensis TaxID=86342 RepID=A0A399R0Q3_9PROT|nr:hypothetical protein D1224_04165 [Henriciella barbarensis]
MTVLEQVAGRIRTIKPNPICDDCLAAEIQLSVRQHANHKTRELAENPGFRREQSHCSRCGSLKKCIRATN